MSEIIDLREELEKRRRGAGMRQVCAEKEKQAQELEALYETFTEFMDPSLKLYARLILDSLVSLSDYNTASPKAWEDIIQNASGGMHKHLQYADLDPPVDA